MKYIDAKRLVDLCVEHDILDVIDAQRIRMVMMYSKQELVDLLKENILLMDDLQKELAKYEDPLAEMPVSSDEDYYALLDACVEQGMMELSDDGVLIVNVAMSPEEVTQRLMNDTEGQMNLKNALQEKGIQFEEIFDKMFPKII